MNSKAYNVSAIGIVAAASLLSVGLLIATVASADTGMGWRASEGEKSACTDERHIAMMQAFENKDYVAWSELMAGRGRVAQMINADTFPTFAALHLAQKSGNVSEVEALRTQLGLGTRAQDGNGYRGGSETGKGYRHGGGNGEQRGYRDGIHRTSLGQ